VPTLVIWGERDEALLIGNLDGLETSVEDLRVVRIADGSHWVVHEQPAKVNALIREFLTGAPRA
jgi:pimeloyl-ACP methyl ester carboxylesterase